MLRVMLTQMKKILVIEDEAQTREIFLQCLTFEGFLALAAANGTTGIEVAQRHAPDLIVCDIMMPDLDGHSVLSALRQNAATAAIPVIFLTAKVTMKDLRQGMALGADDYLTKPCTVEQFLSAINTRLARQDTLKRWYNTPSNLEDVALSSTPVSFFPNSSKLAQVFRFIEAHYSQPIRLTDVAQAVGYSPAYLTHLVQTETGRTVKRWIIERRMAQARSLLATTDQPINRIANAVGYGDVSYFTRQFRQVHAVSPQVWRLAEKGELTAAG